jgi:hypothetical protein
VTGIQNLKRSGRLRRSPLLIGGYFGRSGNQAALIGERYEAFWLGLQRFRTTAPKVDWRRLRKFLYVDLKLQPEGPEKKRMEESGFPREHC